MSSTRIPKFGAESTTLLASAARVANAGANEAAVTLPGAPAGGVAFELDITAAGTDAGDTLDVTIQTLLDGTNWIDVCHFTQALGNGGAKRFVAKISATEPQAMFEVGSALAAGNIRHILGDQYRVNWVLVDANLNGGFTFSVKAMPI